MFGSFTIESLDRTEEFALTQGKVCIGRGADNDLALPFPTVSSRHACVVADSSGCRIVDLGSANGTFVNGRELFPEEECALKDGDVAEIGPFKLRFHLEAARGGTTVSVAPGVTADMYVRPGHTVVLPPNLPPRLAVSAPGWSREFPLGRGVLTLGRDPDNDIVVPVEAVSRRHASLQCRGDDCLLKDLGSTNGIVVAGRLVKATLLTPGDHASIGRTVTLQYLGPVDFAAELVAAAVRGAAEDEQEAAEGAEAPPEAEGGVGGDALVLGHGALTLVHGRLVTREVARLGRTVEGAVLAMGHVVESRDPYTAGHERRVAELAAAIAAEMGLSGEALAAVRLAALIHDIGKMSVPAEILAKPGRLNEAEFNLVKEHARAGFAIIESIDFGYPVPDMVLQHHERLDGTGYPQGLVAEQTMLEARIIAVADVTEAMSSHRPYRPAMGKDAAVEELLEHGGARYDVDVVEACVRLLRERGFEFSS